MKAFSMDQDLRIQIFYVDSKLSETVDSGQTVCSSKKVGDSCSSFCQRSEHNRAMGDAFITGNSDLTF